MYTGITQGLYRIMSVEQGLHHLSFKLKLNELLIQGLKIGDSVSIDGACHTVEGLDGLNVAFTSGAETLEKTTLASIAVGQYVAVERSACIGQEIGGHLMSGHIFGKGRVSAIEPLGENLKLSIQLPVSMMPYIFEKGFIGLNGSSLTINHVDRESLTFQVNLIPQTLKMTDFVNKKIGDELNVELDAQTVAVVDTVKQVLAAHALRYPGEAPRSGF